MRGVHFPTRTQGSTIVVSNDVVAKQGRSQQSMRKKHPHLQRFTSIRYALCICRVKEGQHCAVEDDEHKDQLFESKGGDDVLAAALYSAGNRGVMASSFGCVARFNATGIGALSWHCNAAWLCPAVRGLHSIAEATVSGKQSALNVLVCVCVRVSVCAYLCVSKDLQQACS